MIKTVLIIIGFFIHYYSFCQNDTTLKLIPNWKKGEIKKYEIKKYISVDAENERKANDLTTKVIVLQVTDVKDNELAMNWRVEELCFSDTINQDNPFSGLVNSLDKDISVEYIIDKNGNVIDISNLDEITKTIKTKVDNALKKFIDKNKIEKSKADMLSFQFTMMYSTPEQIKAFVLNDISRFHQIYGFLYTFNKITIIPDNVFAPNAGGQPSNNLLLKLTRSIDSQIISLTGKLECAESNEKLREFVEKDRSVIYEYKIQLPEYWLISNKSTLNSNSGYVNVNITYEINMIE